MGFDQAGPSSEGDLERLGESAGEVWEMRGGRGEESVGKKKQNKKKLSVRRRWGRGVWGGGWRGETQG